MRFTQVAHKGTWVSHGYLNFAGIIKLNCKNMSNGANEAVLGLITLSK